MKVEINSFIIFIIMVIMINTILEDRWKNIQSDYSNYRLSVIELQNPRETGNKTNQSVHQPGFHSVTYIPVLAMFS